MREFGVKLATGALSLFLLAVAGCGGNDDAPTVAPAAGPPDYTYDYSGSGYAVDHLDTPESDTGETTFTYRVNLGSSSRTVFFVFTNTTTADASAPPAAASADTAAEEMAAARQRAAAAAREARALGIGLKDREDVSLFNANPFRYLAEASGGGATGTFPLPSPSPQADTVGGSASFYTSDSTTSGIVNATCRKGVSDGVNTLNIYVDDNAWDAGSGCAEPNCISQAMVDELAGRFLKSGDNNDIHDWVSGVFGPEWGDHNYANLLPASAAGDITILLYDIDGDDSVNGGVVGFFWSKDNILPPDKESSNQRLMFYLDSNLFAQRDGPTWEASDYWPTAVIEALAHEYQHMIFFYQKMVRNGLYTAATWLNEMASETAEDLIADKAGFDGPRGVSGSDGSAGASGNVHGRLPRFNRFDYIPLTRWQNGPIDDPGDSNTLNSYSAAYAFGAYLARNFGGAQLFREMVQNDKDGEAAVSAALAALGYNEDFVSVLRKWGAAVLLSDDPTPAVPQGYRYNTGAFFTSTVAGTTYSLGSIDLTNYMFMASNPYQVGPKYYTTLPSPTDPAAGTYQESNCYYLVGYGLTGTVTRKITLPQGYKLTTVIR